MFKEFQKSAGMISAFLQRILPQVDSELAHWHTYAETHMHGELKKQALNSIRDKKFHCQGGNFYSLYPGVNESDFVRFVVALQTISDYLDNLCDRAGIFDAKAFSQLHLAMEDALNPKSQLRDYYAFYPHQDDGGYLASLVKTCRQVLAPLPSYSIVQTNLLHLAGLYSELQTYKHISPEIRESAMLQWLETRHNPIESGLTHWEFAAATGSTLGMFMLAASAYQPKLSHQQAAELYNAYFPWISGLHILLDYFIDQKEDKAGGDLNFIFYYQTTAKITTRLRLFYRNAYQKASLTPHPYFAKTIVQGLLALYLSDPKIKTPVDKEIRSDLLDEAGGYTRWIYRLCRLLRMKKTL